MEEKSPKVTKPSQADRESAARISDMENAIARLTTNDHASRQRRDKETQIRWGIRDFQRRFVSRS